MRLGHQALRKQQPAVALHYARQVLDRNPSHQFAPRLQRKALLALGAHRSLALLEGTPLSQLPDESQGDGPEPQWWSDCSRLALIGIQNTFLLKSWSHFLRELDPYDIDEQGLQLWLIDCPDPLWLEQQAHQLLAGTTQPVLIRSWPVWEALRHGNVCLTLEAISEAPFWRERAKPAREEMA